MAMVAAGEADLVASMRWGHEWDIAAAALIVSEAGGVVTNALGEPIRFNAFPPRAFGVLESTTGIHPDADNRPGHRGEDRYDIETTRSWEKGWESVEKMGGE